MNVGKQNVGTLNKKRLLYPHSCALHGVPRLSHQLGDERDVPDGRDVVRVVGNVSEPGAGGTGVYIGGWGRRLYRRVTVASV